MTELKQLEHRVQNLSPEEFAEFRAWFLELDARLWDHQAPLEEVRRKIAIGLEQADRGELFDGEEVFREILGKL